ncbi:hypothetical protein [Nigerium sp.]|uniref:hypothetical protein n=1 Tax=Nigerium sp. TaxID=2042655 RepID=UPI003221F5B4
MNWVEVVGYVASALVALSFAMRSVVKLRTVSLVGSAIFAVYGALIGAWPVVITNSIIALLNAWRLRVELAPEASSLKVVEIEPDAPFLRDYLAANLTDIHRSQPEFSIDAPYPFARLITRDGLPAGAFLARPLGDELEVALDYVTPAYRDSSVARWLFGPGKTTFTNAGVRRLVARASTSEHRTYLEACGFVPEGGSYVKQL